MRPIPALEFPKWVLQLINHVYDIERKITPNDPSNLRRNVDRMKEVLEGEGLFFEDPFGQPFNETRTDLDASISGASTEGLVVVEVIKPIIRAGTRSYSRIVQKGVVIVSSTS